MSKMSEEYRVGKTLLQNFSLDDFVALNEYCNKRFLLYQITSCSRDCVGGYGWRDSVCVSIIRPTERYRKCGMYAEDSDHSAWNHRHSWKKVDRVLWSYDGLFDGISFKEAFKQYIENEQDS